MEVVVPSAALIIIGAFSVLALILWIVAFVDLLKSDFRGSNEKLIWVLVILFAPFIGAILYLAIGRKNKVN
jgi:hypothetical protein